MRTIAGEETDLVDQGCEAIMCNYPFKKQNHQWNPPTSLGEKKKNSNQTTKPNPQEKLTSHLPYSPHFMEETEGRFPVERGLHLMLLEWRNRSLISDTWKQEAERRESCRWKRVAESRHNWVIVLSVTKKVASVKPSPPPPASSLLSLKNAVDYVGIWVYSLCYGDLSLSYTCRLC